MNKNIRRHKIKVLIVLSASLLYSCSSVGPGFKNHPGDCALGIPWADCLPGTNGYNNGGGEMHRAEAAKQNTIIPDQFAAVAAQCKADLQTPELDLIRHKVELFRDSFDSATPFEIAVNDTFPTEADRAVIAKWATIRDECTKRNDAVPGVLPTATPLQVTFMQRNRAFEKEAEARVGDLIVSLYQQKLTYGEFAKKRFEITRDAAAAERQLREAALLNNMDRQMQAQQAAQQQFQNNLMAWASYQQAVNARQPQSVYINESIRLQSNCTSQRFGNTVNTSCY